jgi:APA family basic amino acid/polyamine antiporter
MAGEKQEQLGFWMTTALVIGSTIGAGIFMLPVTLAPLGANAVIGWIVSSFGILCLAFAIAQLGRKGGAGIQAYVEQVFGSGIGFLVTWAFWCNVTAGNAAMALAASSATSAVFPVLRTPLSVALLGIGYVCVLVAINATGVRSSGRMAIVTVALKILPLLAAILLAALTLMGGGSLQSINYVPITAGAIATAVALTLTALTGFEAAVAPVNKIKDAPRTVPRAILIGASSVAILYLLCSTSVSLLLPADQLARSPAPFADAIGRSWGSAAAALVSLGMVISALGTLSVGLLLTGELSYSMALRRDMPAWLAWTSGKGTPILGQVFGSAISILLVVVNISGSTAGLFSLMMLISGISILVLYVVGALAAAMEAREPIARLAIVIGFLFSLYAVYGAGLEANLWVCALLAAGIVIRKAIRLASVRQEALAPSG